MQKHEFRRPKPPNKQRDMVYRVLIVAAAFVALVILSLAIQK